MKKLSFILMALLLLLLQQASTVTAQNLDPGFPAATGFERVGTEDPAGFRFDKGGRQLNLPELKFGTNAYEGTGHIEIVGKNQQGANGVFVTSSKYLLEKDNAYEVSIFARIDGGFGTLSMYAVNQAADPSFNDVTSTAPLGTAVVGAGPYKKYTFRFKSPFNSNTPAYLAIQMNHNSGKVTMYLDNLEIKQLCMPNSIEDTYWVGVNTDWFDPINWTACVPNEEINAIILPAGSPIPGTSLKVGTFSPQINNDQVGLVQDLTLEMESVMTLTDDATLDLAGDFKGGGNGEFAPSSTIIFSGSDGQRIPGANFGKLEIKGGGTKVLEGDATIRGGLILTEGKLQIDDFNLTIEEGAEMGNGSATAYIITNGEGLLWATKVGKAALEGRPEVFYPVGTALTYTPATINNTEGNQLATFGVRVKDGVENNGGDTVEEYVVKKTWYVEVDPADKQADVNVTLTLQWNKDDEGDVLGKEFLRSESFVAHFENLAWNRDVTQMGMAVGGLGDGPYSQTRSGITSFSPFGVGSGENSPLPVTLSFFEAEKTGSDALLTWETASEQHNKGFGIEVSTNGEGFRNLGFVNSKVINSQSQQRYSFRDSESGKHGTRYYRLRQTDLDGTVSYSATKAVGFTELLGTSVSAFPNPFGQTLEVVIVAEEQQQARLVFTDVLGRLVHTQEVLLQKGANRQEILLDGRYRPGIYQLTTYVGDRTHRTRLVKHQ
jgi:hypothetical protein